LLNPRLALRPSGIHEGKDKQDGLPKATAREATVTASPAKPRPAVPPCK
jgi:hypothetical protein